MFDQNSFETESFSESSFDFGDIAIRPRIGIFHLMYNSEYSYVSYNDVGLGFRFKFDFLERDFMSDNVSLEYDEDDYSIDFNSDSIDVKYADNNTDLGYLVN